MAQSDERHNVRVTNAQKERVEEEREERRHEEYGGFKFGAAFFGWLVASGLSAMLTALLTATGAAIALTKITNASDATQAIGHGSAVGIVGGILLLIIAAISYYAGGYVAGRMARFDGARQGAGVWIISIVAALLLALAGMLFGAKYNLLQQLNIPHIPINAGKLTLGGLITLLLTLIITLLTAIAGGKAGERYHRKVDRSGA